MDKILIKNLELFGVHGLIPAEKVMPQKFIVSCEGYMDLQKAGKTDNADYTENFHKITDIIMQTVTGTTYNLIEALAEDCATKILTACPILTGLKLKIEKPWVHSPQNAEAFGVEIERKWHSAFMGLKSDNEDALNNVPSLFNSEDTHVENISSVMGSESSDELICTLKLKTLLNFDELIIFSRGIEGSFGVNKASEEVSDAVIIGGDSRDEYVSLNLLLYDDLVTSDELINVPNPEIFENSAFIKTISEISPYAIEPLSGKRFVDLLEMQ